MGTERLWPKNFLNRLRFCTKRKYLEPKQKEQFSEFARFLSVGPTSDAGTLGGNVQGHGPVL